YHKTNHNRMGTNLAVAELKIGMSSVYTCGHFYEYLLPQPDILKSIRANKKV
ncbi:unnamed protein product, partial [Rotaria sp. Silwood1]